MSGVTFKPKLISKQLKNKTRGGIYSRKADTTIAGLTTSSDPFNITADRSNCNEAA